MSALALYRATFDASTWILTFAVHGVVVHLAALGAGRWRLASPRRRDILWKVALLLPFATTTWAMLAPTRAWRSEWYPLDVVRRTSTALWQATFPIRTSDGGSFTAMVSTNGAALLTIAVLLGAALVTSIAALVVAIRRRRAFYRALGARVVVPPPDVLADAAPSVAVTVSSAVAGPVALAWAEICLPAELDQWLHPAQQRSVLLHEFEHVRRKDAVWFAVADLIAVVAPWQPLVRAVARSLRRDAEFLCDDAVVRRTGDARSLVESLAILAARFDPAATVRVPAGGGSPLEERARCLLSPGSLPEAGWRPLALMLGLVATVGAVAPLLSTHAEPSSPTASKVFSARSGAVPTIPSP